MDNKTWGATYRDVVFRASMGQALAIHIMGLETAWNNPVFLEYVDSLS